MAASLGNNQYGKGETTMLQFIFYKIPFLSALSFLLLGFGLLLAGIMLEENTRSMDYFAMSIFGVFSLIVGLTTFAVYLKMEREYCKTAGSKPRLGYTVAGKLLKKGVEKRAKELQAQTRELLVVMPFLSTVQHRPALSSGRGVAHGVLLRRAGGLFHPSGEKVCCPFQGTGEGDS